MIKRRNFIKKYWVDYTANSNLHGLKYIGEKERMFIEKVYWLFMFTCCVVLCALVIGQLWKKWNERPVIVTFAENSTPVWQIPFPAVTVCMETKAVPTKFNFTRYYHLYNNTQTLANLTEKDRCLLEDVSLLCDGVPAPRAGRKHASGVDTLNNIKQVSPNMAEVLSGCEWKATPKDACEELFSPILTEEGPCYTFNTVGAQYLFRVEKYLRPYLHKDYQYLEHANSTLSWTLGDGYTEDTPLETYPHRGEGYGVSAGLSFLLRFKKIDLDYLCKGAAQGLKILLHNPAELPRLSTRYFRSPLSQEMLVAVKPEMMTTTPGLRSYDPISRQCYFPDERYLQYYKVYTQANCETECLTNFTYARCGCVHFGLPYGPNMTVCNAGSVECMKNAQSGTKFAGSASYCINDPMTIVELVTAALESGLDAEASEDDTLGVARKKAEQCQCLPACTSIEYEAETSQADWKNYKIPIDDEIVEQVLHYGRVKVFFKEAQFITSRRSELYGRTDFLANCGGLLGLFMGFSVLSVAEMLYFLTLRLCCIIWPRPAAAERAAAPALEEQQHVSSPE